MTSSELSASDVALLTDRNNGGMFGDGNGAWWIIILFLFAFCGGWGNGGFGGGYSGGAADNYVLASDFATIQRQLSDGFNAQERRTDAIVNGICDLGYTQQTLANQTNMNVMQGFNATQSQMASCCCDLREAISGVNYNSAMQTNAIQKSISDGFCQTNFNIDKVGDRIIDYLSQEKTQALRDENFALRLAASQQAQNNYIVDRLSPVCPQPAYLVANPNGALNYSFNNGCPCGYNV